MKLGELEMSLNKHVAIIKDMKVINLTIEMILNKAKWKKDHVADSIRDNSFVVVVDWRGANKASFFISFDPTLPPFSHV